MISRRRRENKIVKILLLKSTGCTLIGPSLVWSTRSKGNFTRGESKVWYRGVVMCRFDWVVVDSNAVEMSQDGNACHVTGAKINGSGDNE